MHDGKIDVLVSVLVGTKEKLRKMLFILRVL